MRSGAIIFVEIPVRDLARAADFYAGLFGWSFEDDENVEGWHFTPGSGGPMGRIVTSRPAGVGGVRFTVAVADIAGTTSRAIALGGGYRCRTDFVGLRCRRLRLADRPGR